MTGKERTACLVGCALVAALILAAWLVRAPATKTLLDNLQWTLSFGGSAWLAWRGLAGASGAERSLRRALFAGALLIFLGQLAWDLQVYSGWNPFPAPADVFFLGAASTWIGGWLAVIVQRLPRERLMPSLLDIGSALSALIAAILTLYMPSGGNVQFSVLIALVAYPVLFLLAAGLGVLMVPALRLRFGAAHLLTLAGMTGYGYAWMQWNLYFLDGALVPGGLFNASYSLAALMFGLGVRHVHLEQDVRAGVWRERTMAYLPLVAMSLALLTLVMLFRSLEHGAGIAPRVVFACCLLALGLTTLRQTLMVGVLERLRDAERAILRNETQMYRLANFDALTGLPNRCLFESRLEHGLREANQRQTRVAVMLIDLDHFKQINDAFGHHVGDRLLREVADRLQACLQTDATLARMGGDEFMLMLEWARSRTDVAALAQALLEALDRPWPDTGMGQQFVGASIGISMHPDDAGSPVELIRNADAALNQAKSDGRGTYRFYVQDYTDATRRKLALRSRLHLARLEEEFRLVYQPQYDQQRVLIGLEALLRWTVDGTSVPPDEFIPIAEESGVIVPIGDWVFASACRQIVAWRAQGLRVPPVSVNVSARQLAEPDLAGHFAGIARDLGVDPADLTLEVTESQLLDARMLPSVEALRKAGFSLSMDDFGTGQSSLVKLKMLPVSELKIDKAFVRDIATDPGDREICATIHALAGVLGIEVVAEGVETVEQFDLLVAMGCQRFQGWLFAAAMPPEQVPLPVADAMPAARDTPSLA
ncbi:putative bifunctional diguanylate cyclase/phosphodiesterase [Thermomonas sp.]|uniref:putative bifunctional diguanylate cyclase/phosphodiesterase n=1 Tax=Thermomonas sp. TaxID=1971895 RepID=UPI0035AF880F